MKLDRYTWGIIVCCAILMGNTASAVLIADVAGALVSTVMLGVGCLALGGALHMDYQRSLENKDD